jgi:glycosyltransferase involved in cell wall biosynthesis
VKILQDNFQNPPPRVSVITPAWNAEATLRRAHTSLHAQQVPWQHIIVNDGSSDGTEAICQELAANDPRVTCVSRPNGGHGAALNTGLTLASAEYIAFLDADDEYLPGHLDLRVRFLEQFPALDLLWGGLELVLAPGDTGMVPDVEKGYGEIALTECVVQGTLFARRRVFDSLQYSEDRKVWYADYDLVRRARQFFQVQKVDFPTYRYYRDSGKSMVDRVKAELAAGLAAAPTSDTR